MSQKNQRVVETKWIGTGRTEIDLGHPWTTPNAAKKMMRELKQKHPARLFSIQTLQAKR
ncbi:hypothetical protein ACXIUT_23945 [Achromobacter denitrificans]